MNITTISLAQVNKQNIKYYPIKYNTAAPNFKGGVHTGVDVINNSEALLKYAKFVGAGLASAFLAMLSKNNVNEEVIDDTSIETLVDAGLKEFSKTNSTDSIAAVEQVPTEKQNIVSESLAASDVTEIPEIPVIDNSKVEEKPKTNYIETLAKGTMAQVSCRISNENKKDMAVELSEMMQVVKGKILGNEDSSSVKWFAGISVKDMPLEDAKKTVKEYVENPKSYSYKKITKDNYFTVVDAIYSEPRFNNFTLNAAVLLVDTFVDFESVEPINTQCKKILDALFDRLEAKLHSPKSQAQVMHYKKDPKHPLCVGLTFNTTYCSNDIKARLMNAKSIKIGFCDGQNGEILISQVLPNTESKIK